MLLCIAKRLLVATLVLLAASPATADMAQGDPRLERLFSMFMAPCCWRESLLVHQSPKADELRAQIRSFVRQGWTDDQIKLEMVTGYQRRILAMPDGAEGRILRWMPAFALLAGLCGVVLMIRRLLKKQSQTEPTAADLPEVDLEG